MEEDNNQEDAINLNSNPENSAPPISTPPSQSPSSVTVTGVTLQNEDVIFPELSLAETHPDANTPGFISEVPDTYAKKYVFRSKSKTVQGTYDTVTVVIRERMMDTKAGHGLRVWPCAPILAWYLFEHREFLVDKKVLELGAGTALPGVLSAKCGAKVTLSDSLKYPHCLERCRNTAEINGVLDKVEIIGLTWGLFLNSVTKLRDQVDLIIAADCFFDPVVFEDLISTVAYILENNPNAKFLSTYQERSSDWSIQHLLRKWGLQCKHIPLKDLANACRIDLLGLMQNYTIHLIEITLKK